MEDQPAGADTSFQHSYACDVKNASEEQNALRFVKLAIDYKVQIDKLHAGLGDELLRATVNQVPSLGFLGAQICLEYANDWLRANSTRTAEERDCIKGLPQIIAAAVSTHPDRERPAYAMAFITRLGRSYPLVPSLTQIMMSFADIPDPELFDRGAQGFLNELPAAELPTLQLLNTIYQGDSARMQESLEKNLREDGNPVPTRMRALNYLEKLADRWGVPLRYFAKCAGML